MRVLLFFLFWQYVPADPLEALYRQSTEYMRQNQYVLALAGFRDLLKVRPQHVGAAIRAGYCFEKVGQPEFAARYYRQALEYDPGSAVAKEGLRRTAIQGPSDTAAVQKALDIRIYTKETTTPSENKALQRLWINRKGQIYTMLSDGRDLRRLSQVVFGWIQKPERDFGFLAEMESAEDTKDGETERDLFYFDAHTGLFHALSRSRDDEFLPGFHDGQLYFLRKQGQGAQLYTAALDAQSEDLSKATQVLSGFSSVESYFLGLEGLWFTAMASLDRPIATYYMPYKQKVEPVSQGLIHHDRILPSADEQMLAVRTRDGTDLYNYLLIHRTKNFRTPLLTQPVAELEGCFSPDGSRFYYSASALAGKDGWDTSLGEYNLVDGTHRILWKHNFLNRNLMVDEDSNWLYFTTNYDNNFEVYRKRISDLERERLTVSDEDEVQLGFWSLATW